MVAKRKTVTKLTNLPKATKGKIEEAEEEMEVDDQIVAVQEEPKEVTEKELVAARTKELSAMRMDDLKEEVTRNGLETGKKDAMIKSLLKFEAKARAAAREQKAKIRDVVVKKKQELEAKSLPELSKLVDAIGIKGLRSKEERVQRLLVHWQETDGVDKALAEAAAEERAQQLRAMDTPQLQKICQKTGVDPYVKEIIVDRISKRENEVGCYSRPAIIQEEEQKTSQSTDMVEALLANEAQRKKERESKTLQEDKAAQKRKELKALSIDELKKRIAKKGLEVTGKKDEMVDALFLLAVQEEAAVARQAELKAKSLPDLKELVARTGLELGSKDQMVKALLAHEEKTKQNLKAFEAKVGEAAELKKQQLDTKSAGALKEMCASMGLAVGGGKDERIERIVEEAQRVGELDKVVCQNIRNKRKEELMAMDKQAVVQLCQKTGVEPVVKEIVVERILAHESESGSVIAMTDEPAAKKARIAKK